MPSNPTPSEALREALEQIACFNDEGANRWLEKSGSWAGFDEPSSVQIARAALSRTDPVAEGEWQDIESAPKDGQFILVARFRDGDEFCWAKHSRWITAEELADNDGLGDPDDFEAGWTDGNEDDEPCYPTHWRPLPAPPKTPEQQP